MVSINTLLYKYKWAASKRGFFVCTSVPYVCMLPSVAVVKVWHAIFCVHE